MSMFLVSVLIGCGGELLVAPDALDYGVVNVHGDMPSTGYAALDLTLTNETGRDLDLSLLDLDSDRFVIGALTVSDDPPTLDTLTEDGRTVITLGIRGYETGERDTEVTGTIRLAAPDLAEPVLVPWSYTPTRVLDDEDGR